MPSNLDISSRSSPNQPKEIEVVSVERLTFYTLHMIFLLFTVGIIYWFIAPTVITAWTQILDALSTVRV